MKKPVAPADERRAISLPGATANPAPEAWETIEKEVSIPGVASVSVAEIWVRNVSQPTLLPFLPDHTKLTGAAMIVAPGGAFMRLAIGNEGYAVANWLNRLGIAAFVLKYRVAATPADPHEAAIELAKRDVESAARAKAGARSLSDLLSDEQREAMSAAREDALEAVRCVRAHAGKWHVSPSRVGIIGFSAGAGTAIDVALNADAANRPDLVAAIYGAMPNITEVPSTAPPAFIAVAADDEFMSYSVAIYQAWREGGAAAELHVLESGGHGFGIRPVGSRSGQWPDLFGQWLAVHGFGSLAAIGLRYSNINHQLPGKPRSRNPGK